MRKMEHEVVAAGFRSFVSFFSCVVHLHRLITRVDKASAQWANPSLIHPISVRVQGRRPTPMPISGGCQRGWCRDGAEVSCWAEIPSRGATQWLLACHHRAKRYRECGCYAYRTIMMVAQCKIMFYSRFISFYHYIIP
jgi:hypothetical protein